MSGHKHEGAAVVVGSEPPAVSISWEPDLFVIFWSDSAYPDEGDGADESMICLGCLVEEGDEQLGRGLDLAREHGQVDWNDAGEEWFVPAAATG